MTRLSWDEYGIALAMVAATRSEDRVQVGAAVLRADHSVAGAGYNGLPVGVELDILSDDARKMIIHAESNALQHSHGDVAGGTLYSTHHPCVRCMTRLVACGINRVVTLDLPWKGRNSEDNAIKAEILGIEVIIVE